MRPRTRCALLLAAGLALAPMPGAAVLPAAIAALGKQLVQQALTSTVKGLLLGSLRDAGCKGIAMANALEALDSRSLRGMAGAMADSELQECMLVLPQTTPALGMAFGMLQPMLPQLRAAREQLQALSPAEQDELAVGMAADLRDLPADERRRFLGQLDGGFFPPGVAEGVKRRLR